MKALARGEEYPESDVDQICKLFDLHVTYTINHKVSGIMKNRQALIRVIKEYFEKSKHPIEKVWLFGSYARGEEYPESDVDLMIRFAKPNKIDLWDYAEIMLDLEDLTGTKVDLVQEGRLKDFAKITSQKDKILIYERKAEEQRTSASYP